MSKPELRIPATLERHARTIASALEPCVLLKPREPSSPAAVSATQLFGSPHLPHMGDWPRSPEGRALAFVGQVHFSGLPPGVETTLPILPRQGMLLLFYDVDRAPEGTSPDDRYSFRVLWLPETQLSSAIEPPRDATRIAPASFPLSASLAWRLPEEGDASFRLGSLSEREFLAYEALSSTLGAPCENQLLGPASWLTEDARDVCKKATAPLWPGEDSWRLLWQIGGETGLSDLLGDEARLHVMIREGDLAARRFLRAWVILQRA